MDITSYTKEELCLIWLDSFLGLEYRHKERLIAISGELDATTILQKGKDYLLTNLDPNVYSTLKNSLNVDYIKMVLKGLERHGVKAVTIRSKDYPQKLKNVKIPPLVLYTKGNIQLLNDFDSFAIVGSRKSLPQSLAIAKDYASRLLECSFTLVTGIAQGVDQTVCQTAVDKGGKIISVITGGIANVYPKSNTQLLEKVAKVGLVISEYPPEVSPMPYMFPIRNRLFAGLSKGVLIVSAGRKSGTLWTADYALEYGKDVFAVPYSVGIASGEGCNSLIKQGAILTDTPKDILDFYGIEQKTKSLDLSDEEQAIVKILGEGEKHVEQISVALNKRAIEITPTLSIMEIKGLVIKNGNVYQLTSTHLEG